MRNRFFLLAAFFIFSGLANAQTLKHTRYLLSFTDKNQSSFSTGDPSKYLSQRAITRRNTQNIAIDATDLPVNASYVDAVKQAGAKVNIRSKWLNAVAVEIYDTNVLIAVKNLSCVKKTEYIKKKVRPGSDGTKPMFRAESFAPLALHSGSRVSGTNEYNYGEGDNQIRMMHGEVLHNNGYQGQGMVIAVLDAGFLNANAMAAFDSLRAHNQILGSRDFVKGDTMVYEDDAHGTEVLSAMAANLPGQLVGTAPKASYWLLRTEDAATEYRIEEVNWVAGAEFADSVGVDVINSSLGYTEFDDPQQNYRYSDMNGKTTICSKGATTAARKGILVVVSAGNDGDDAWHYIGTPGDADSILTVGAVDKVRNPAGFSSRGPSADGRIKPNVATQGQEAVVASPFGDVFAGNGTSFSSPIMAGIAACFWQTNKSMTNMEVLDSIQKISSTYKNPNSDIGYGIPDFSKSLVGIKKTTEAGANTLTVFNNPASTDENWLVQIATDVSQQANAYLVDILGKTISNISIGLSQGNNSIALPFKQVNTGTYILRVTLPQSGNILQAKVVKL